MPLRGIKGTTSLFAALDVATGRVIGGCYPRHPRRNACLAAAAEFRRFLDRIERVVPDDLDVHLVMDDHATHKTQLVRDWMAKRPRWHAHLTPVFPARFRQRRLPPRNLAAMAARTSACAQHVAA